LERQKNLASLVQMIDAGGRISSSARKREKALNRGTSRKACASRENPLGDLTKRNCPSGIGEFEGGFSASEKRLDRRSS